MRDIFGKFCETHGDLVVVVIESGEDGVNVYKNVAGPGREKRKAEFIELWDHLAENGTIEFQITEESSDVCMKLMNATIKDLSANPWWLKWVSASMLAVVGGSIAAASS